MKRFAIILLLAASSCASQEDFNGDPQQAASQIQRWVPSGTPVAAAQNIMTKHAFACSWGTNEIDSLRFLDCYQRSGGGLSSMVLTVDAQFPVRDGKVETPYVEAYWEGP